MPVGGEFIQVLVTPVSNKNPSSFLHPEKPVFRALCLQALFLDIFMARNWQTMHLNAFDLLKEKTFGKRLDKRTR